MFTDGKIKDNTKDVMTHHGSTDLMVNLHCTRLVGIMQNNFGNFDSRCYSGIMC